MRKIFYSLVAVLLLSFSLYTGANAQNIGSLKNVVTPGFSFTMDLAPGYTDNQVLQLQRVLNADVDTTISLEGDGSKGKETKYFGDKTKNAVIKFQEKYRDTVLTPYGLSKGTGSVGKATRTKLNLLIGVMNTNDSVGLPESRGNTTSSGNTSTYIPPVTPITTGPVAGIPVCQFVDLMYSLGVVDPMSYQSGRSSLGCSGTTTQGLTPSVDIKVNDKDGSLSISSPRNVTVSWTSKNVTSCQSSSGSRPLSGSTNFYVDSSGTFVISCTGPYGTVTDSVAVSLGSDNSALSASCFANPSSTVVNNNIVWTAQASGGNGSYTYSWSGLDGLSGSGSSVSKTYSSSGAKSASVKVSSNGSSVTVNCSSLTVAPSNTTLNNLLPGFSTSSNKYALSLSGRKGDYIAVNNSSSLRVDRQITLEAWVKPSSWRTNSGTITDETISTIVVKGQVEGSWDYWLGLDNGKIYYSSGKGGTAVNTCSSVVPLSQWSHVAVSVNEDTNIVSMYLNGKQVSSLCYKGGFSASNGISTSNSNLYLGNAYPKYCSVNSYNYGFNGLIDDVRIWNKARTASDISASTSTLATSTVTTSLVARWTFDSSYASDVTGNGNNGSIFGINTSSVQGSPLVSAASDSPSTSFAGNVGFTNVYVSDIACIVDKTNEQATTTPEELPEGPAPKIPFAGYVSEVKECNPINSSEVKLWQVAIKACDAGGQVTSMSNDGGISSMGSTEPGYIVIREGMQPVPEVGDTVLGDAVPDQGHKCTNAISDVAWIGTVTGALGIGEGEGTSCSSYVSETEEKKQKDEHRAWYKPWSW